MVLYLDMCEINDTGHCDGKTPIDNGVTSHNAPVSLRSIGGIDQKCDVFNSVVYDDD